MIETKYENFPARSRFRYCGCNSERRLADLKKRENRKEHFSNLTGILQQSWKGPRSKTSQRFRSEHSDLTIRCGKAISTKRLPSSPQHRSKRPLARRFHAKRTTSRRRRPISTSFALSPSPAPRTSPLWSRLPPPLLLRHKLSLSERRCCLLRLSL